MDSTTFTLKRIGRADSICGTYGMTDRAVVEQVLKGDKNAYSILVDKYQDRLYSVVLNYTNNPDDAVDIVQDALVKAYSSLKSYNSSAAFYTWIYRIAVNTAIDYLRKKKVRKADSLEDEKYTEIGYEPVCKDNTFDPESYAERSEIRTEFRAAIAQLSEKLRAAIVLHDVEGLSQEEVAEILKIPVGTVKSRVSRARSELRELLRNKIGELI